MDAKPTFPPGWILPGGEKILQRIDKQHFVEVFSLDTGEFLYLFHEEELVKKLKARDLSYETFLIGSVEIPGKKYPKHTEGDITERLKNIIQRRGLDAIAGMNALKTILIRDVIHPFLNWKDYEKYGVSPSNGILFFGPPGCGKTFIAKRLAEAIRAELIELTDGTVGSTYRHATTQNIVSAFQRAERMAPSVIFMDEISGLMPRREDLPFHENYRETEINEFLMLMEGSVQKKILVVGATNFPEKLDPAVLRSGRMDKKIFIPPPDDAARCELFRLFLEDRPTSDDIIYEELSRITTGLICSDLKLIVNNAALKALHSNTLISMKLLRNETFQFRPSLSKADLNRYLKFAVY